jgi:hypothetical protein
MQWKLIVKTMRTLWRNCRKRQFAELCIMHFSDKKDRHHTRWCLSFWRRRRDLRTQLRGFAARLHSRVRSVRPQLLFSFPWLFVPAFMGIRDCFRSHRPTSPNKRAVKSV